MWSKFASHSACRRWYADECKAMAGLASGWDLLSFNSLVFASMLNPSVAPLLSANRRYQGEGRQLQVEFHVALVLNRFVADFKEAGNADSQNHSPCKPPQSELPPDGERRILRQVRR